MCDDVSSRMYPWISSTAQMDQNYVVSAFIANGARQGGTWNAHRGSMDDLLEDVMCVTRPAASLIAPRSKSSKSQSSTMTSGDDIQRAVSTLKDT